MNIRPIDANGLKKSITDYHAGLFPRYISKLVDAEIEDIKDIIDEQITLDYVPRQQWISVKDRLPEDDENLHFYDDGQLRFTSVLVHDKNRGTDIENRLMIRHHSMPIFDELATEGWVWSRPYEPTHWMPLPEEPKEE